MRLRIVLLGCALFGAVVLAACDQKSGDAPPVPPQSAPAAERTTAATTAPRVFDRAAMQADVARILADDYRLGEVTDVVCPEGQVVGSGREFSCEATVDGLAHQVPIRVRGSQGEYEVGMPPDAG